jgi:hypothetical protein
MGLPEFACSARAGLQVLFIGMKGRSSASPMPPDPTCRRSAGRLQLGGVSAAPLAHRLAGRHDLALARAVVANRLATLGPESFAHELEPVIGRAAAGFDTERRAMPAIPSSSAGCSTSAGCARVRKIRLDLPQSLLDGREVHGAAHAPTSSERASSPNFRAP